VPRGYRRDVTNFDDDTVHDRIDTAGVRADAYIDRSPLRDAQKDSLHKASSAAASAAHDATDSAVSAFGAARDSANRVVGRVSDEYEKRPLSVLAVGIGLLALVGVIAYATRSRN
jgi:hypothetical protein